MKIAAGVIVLLAAILCFTSGACNMAAAGAGKVGKSAIASGLRLLESSSGEGGITASARAALRKRGAALAVGGEDRRAALQKIRARAAEVVRELEEASTVMFLAGGLAALGGLLAFAAAVLLITGQGRGFIITAMLVAMAGTGLGLLTPFTVTTVALLKLGLLGLGAAVGATVREEVRP